MTRTIGTGLSLATIPVSSAGGDFVSTSDVAYLAWKATEGAPTRIASEAELGEVLAAYARRPTAVNVLDSYKDKQAEKLTAEAVARVLFHHENRIRALERVGLRSMRSNSGKR